MPGAPITLAVWLVQTDDAFHQRCMGLALDAARNAEAHGDVPVGAVIVDEAGDLLAVGENRRELDQDATAHAELVAIRRACQARRAWRLQGATLYVTLEPCPMCAGALVNARLRRVVYGCTDPKAGAVESLFEIATDPRLNHRLDVLGGVCAEEAAGLLRAFFARRRRPSPG